MPKDQVVAILEQIQGDFKVFGEMLSDIQKSIKNLEVKFDRVIEKFNKA